MKHGTKEKREAQFNQNYHPGSISTNINNVSPSYARFNGQQNYGAGSFANNYGGKRKREAQFNQNYNPGSISTNINSLSGLAFPPVGGLGYDGRFGAGFGGPSGFGPGVGSTFNQGFGPGSTANNFGRKKREANEEEMR